VTWPFDDVADTPTQVLFQANFFFLFRFRRPAVPRPRHLCGFAPCCRPRSAFGIARLQGPGCALEAPPRLLNRRFSSFPQSAFPFHQDAWSRSRIKCMVLPRATDGFPYMRAHSYLFFIGMEILFRSLLDRVKP